MRLFQTITSNFVVGTLRRFLRLRNLLLTFVVLLTTLFVAAWLYCLQEFRTARTELSADRPLEALQHLRLPLMVFRWDPDVSLLAGRASRISGDLPSAEYFLNRCLQQNGAATEALQLEFLLLRVQTGEVDTVFPALLAAVDGGHPESQLILNTLTLAYIHNLRFKPAFACLSKLIEINPNLPKAHYTRGLCLERLGNHKAARDDYHRALELDPEMFQARLRVAEMLLDDHQAPEALPHLERLHRQSPDRPEVMARLGACRLLEGRTQEARALMEKAVLQMPTDPPLLVNLANLEIQDGNGAAAEKWLRKILETDATDNEALYSLVTALKLQNRIDEAEKTLQDYERYKVLVARSNQLLQDSADTSRSTPAELAELGDILMQAGRERLALYWLNKAIEKDPENQRSHQLLAAYYNKKGDLQMAATHARQLRGLPAPSPTEPKPPQR